MEGKSMSTTVTVVDPFKGTVVVETDRDVEVFLGSQTSIKVGGRPIEEGIATAALQIRTPEPEDQTMKVTVQDSKPKSVVQDAADKMAADEAKRKDRELLDDIQASQDAPGATEPEKSDESPETSPELKLERPAARKKAIKTCAKPGCGVQFEGANRQMYCDDHKTGAGKPKIQAADASGHPTADTPLPEGHWWCIHHQAQVTHRSPECPLLEQKSPQQIAKEAEEAAGKGEAFTDPWKCGRCREEQHLCKLHRSMAASGSKPPLNL